MAINRVKLDADGKPVLDSDGKAVLEEIPQDEIDANASGIKAGSDGFAPITSQEDLDKMLVPRLKRLEKSIRADVKTELEKENERMVAEAAGDYKKIAEDAKAELKELRDKQKQQDTKDLKAKIAKEVGLPDDAIERVFGETEEEIRDDAKKLLKVVGKREAPDDIDLNNSNRATRKTDADAERKKMSEPSFWGIPSVPR